MEVLINRFNKGILYTNQNCVACNKCIMDCCVPGANIAINKNGKSRVEVSSSNCISCGSCADTCPCSAISEGENQYVIDADACVSCGACAAGCPVEAISEE